MVFCFVFILALNIFIIERMNAFTTAPHIFLLIVTGSYKDPPPTQALVPLPPKQGGASCCRAYNCSKAEFPVNFAFDNRRRPLI